MDVLNKLKSGPKAAPLKKVNRARTKKAPSLSAAVPSLPNEWADGNAGVTLPPTTQLPSNDFEGDPQQDGATNAPPLVMPEAPNGRMPNPNATGLSDGLAPEQNLPAPPLAPLTGRQQAQAGYDSAIAAKPQHQGKWAQAGWMGLQGVQKFIEGYNGNFSGQPVQWLGDAKKDYRVGQAAKQLAPYLQQDQVKAGQATEAAKMRGLNANTAGQLAQNDQTTLQTVMAGRPDQKFTEEDVNMLGAKGISVRAGSWANQSVTTRNGVSYNIDNRGGVTKSALPIQATESIVSDGNNGITTAGQAAQNNVNRGNVTANNQTKVAVQELRNTAGVTRDRIAAASKINVASLKAAAGGTNSDGSKASGNPKKVAFYSEAERYFKEAADLAAKAQSIGAQYEGQSNFAYEMKGKKEAEEAVKQAKIAEEKAYKAKAKADSMK